MAILTLDPDNIALIRWVIGVPISIFTPGITFIFSRISANTSSFERLSSTNGASISEVFTPNACSSSSARPVLRPTVCTSGTDNRISSAIRPILSDSSSEIPGRVLMLIVNEPSLNGGRKLRPNEAIIINAAINIAPIPPKTTFLWHRVHCKATLYPDFSLRTR